MSKHRPVHALGAKLEAARLRAIEDLASASDADALPAEALRHIADLHLALMAVRGEIAAHEVRLGGGGERGLE